MKKITYRIFISLIIFVFSLVIYISFIGIKTDKFNSKITNQIKKINQNLDIELKQVNIILDIFTLKLNAKTVGANLIYKDKEIQLENIKSKISIKALIEGKFSLTGLDISTKSLDIKNLITFVSLFRNDIKVFLAQRFVKKGFVVSDIKIEFDDFGNVKNNYKINGLVKDVKVNVLDKYELKKLDFIFEISNDSFTFNDIQLLINNKKIFVPQILALKKNEEFLVSGKINNKKTTFNAEEIRNIINNKALGTEIQKITLESENNFKFKINKNLKIRNLNINSDINLSNLVLINNFDLKQIFPGIIKDTIFENHKIKINYNNGNYNINGSGKILLQEKFDNIEYKISKNKDQINYFTILKITKNLFKLDLLNYEKNKKTSLELEIKAKKKVNKGIIFEKISLKEQDNIIYVENLVLSKENKINKINKIKFDYKDNENFKNKIQILYKDKIYLVKGNSFNINKIIENILNTDEKKQFKLLTNDLKFNFDINKIYLDQNNELKDLKGFLLFKNNKVFEANIESKFLNQKKIKFTIKTRDDKKITTLFSNEAKPIVDRYKFIKGFKKGSLDFYSVKTNNNSKSTLKIYDFKLKELPVLTSILTLASLQGIADLLSGEGIRFNEFEMNFTNKDNLMTIDEIYAIGPAISVLVEGYVEKNKIISLKGTLVPATTINKTIASIPVLGNILVGKKVGEGVFGVSFKIKGPPKNPETTVNPIKTLTPRFITRTIEKIKKN